MMIRAGITVLILVLLIMLPALVLRSEPAVLALSHWFVDTFTDLRLELSNPRVRLYEGRLSADEIHLVPKGSPGPALLSILDFQADITLSDFFFARLDDSRMQSSAVVIYVSEGDDIEDPEPMEWLQKITWLPQTLRAETVHVVTVAGNTHVLLLEELQGNRAERYGFRATAIAHYRAEPVRVGVDLSALKSVQYVTGLDIEGWIEDSRVDSRADFVGHLRGTDTEFQYDLNLEAHHPDAAAFIGFQGGWKLKGPIRLSAKMRGDTQSFELEDATFILDNMPAYRFEALGSLLYRGAGDSSIRLQATGDLESLHYLVDWIGPDLAEVGRAQANISVSGSLDALFIDDFNARIENDEGLVIDVGGHIVPGENELTSGMTPDEMVVQARGPNLAVLERWIGTFPYDLGTWRASGKIHGSPQRIAVDDVVLEMGSRDTFALRAEGRVGNITRSGEAGNEDGRVDISEVALSASAYSPDSAHLAALFDRELPPDHAVSASLVVRGDRQKLEAETGEITIETGDLTLRATPIKLVLYPDRENPLQDVVAPFTLEVADSSALSRYTVAEVPALGPVRVSGNLVQDESTFRVDDLALGITGDRIDLQAQGHVADLGGFSGVALSGEFSGLDTRRLLLYLFDELPYDRPLDALQGNFQVAEAGGKWQLTDFHLLSSRSGGPLELEAAGSVRDLTGSRAAEIDASFHARDPALLEAATGFRMNPGEGRLRIRTDRAEIEVLADLRLGDSELEGRASVGRTRGAIDQLSLSVVSPQMRWQDLGLQAEEAGGKSYKPAAQIEQAVDQENTLGDIGENVPDYPVDVVLQVSELLGKQTDIHQLDVHLTSRDKRVTVRRFNADIDGALTHFRGVADFSTAPSAFSVSARALYIPLGELAQRLGIATDVTGDLAIRGGLTAFGDNREALLASLDGSLAFALEDAVIEGAAYDLLATDLLAWIYSGAAGEESTYIDCTMAHFSLEQGVAETGDLYIETEQMVATGEGRFDFPARKMDLKLAPRSKSRVLEVPSSVRISGDFDDLQPHVSPIAAVADASAEVITLIPQLAKKFFGAIGHRKKGKKKPCHR
jgi:hypothetical protein